MKQYFTVTLLAALFATLLSAAAEESGGHQAELEPRFAEARERVDLTDGQAERIEPIILSGAEATRQVKECPVPFSEKNLIDMALCRVRLCCG